MDDLDHSMHIAEYDWTSFYEESEECCFRQPSLACPDNLSLSDSEDSGNAGRQHNTAANWNESESVAEGCCAEEAQTNPEREDEEDREVWTSSETSLRNPEGNTINIKDGLAGFADPVTVERTERDDDTTATRHEQLNVQPSDGEPTELQKEDGDVQTQSDTGTLDSLQEHDPLSCNQTALHANAPNAVCRPGSEDVGSVSEKERWFVTVNDNPARQRSRAPSGKKKRRQKKPRKNNQTSWAPVQEKPDESSLELQMRKDSSGSEGGRETSGGYTGAEETPEGEQVSDVSQMSGEEDSLPEKHATSKPSDENTMSDGDKHEPIRSAQETLQPRGPPRLDSVESDEFMSTHSYDSETYLSAAESVEEPLRLLMEDQHLQRTSSLFSLTENTNADESQDRKTSLHERALCCDASAANCEGYKSTDVEPALTFPSVGQSANKMPDDNSTCDRDTHSTAPCIPSEAPPPQNHEINLSASGCSSGDQFSLVPKLTVTPCSVADSPETYAKAAGHPRPVYAISAFWDEMEKLTINDILQLRVGRKTPPGDTRETVTPDVDDLQTNQSSLVDTAEYSSSDGGLMDTSDAADSDYFTQPDESKPDRSSCEFSTSDFEEEYWQFLGASRNPSPDPQSKHQDRTGDSPYFDEEETASSEGKETPVPLEDFVERSFENQDSNALISAGLLLPGRMMKSKSLHNVHALSTEDTPLQMLLGEDETSVLLSSFSPLEENLVLKASDTLGTLEPASFLSHTQVVGEYDQILNPEVFRYFLTDNKAERDSRCVSVFDPEDISVAPVFDYTLRAFTEERPIPIFTCSRPTLGELTFPNPDYVFLSADFMDDEDIISPIKVVSRAFVQGNDFGTSAAAGFPSWKSLLLMRKIRFQDKGSIWCGKSGAWVFPLEAEKVSIDRADPPVSVLTESGDTLTPQLFTELAVQQTTRRQGVFSTLKQSDMCLVCIAFASWVLKSSDPKAADTWKAALLANVSALSAIQYLRQYVKRRNPSQDDP